MTVPFLSKSVMIKNYNFLIVKKKSLLVYLIIISIDISTMGYVPVEPWSR